MVRSLILASGFFLVCAVSAAPSKGPPTGQTTQPTTRSTTRPATQPGLLLRKGAHFYIQVGDRKVPATDQDLFGLDQSTLPNEGMHLIFTDESGKKRIRPMTLGDIGGFNIRDLPEVRD